MKKVNDWVLLCLIGLFLSQLAVAADCFVMTKPAGFAWIQKKEAWYPGQEGGTAIANVLFGDYNPAGRLPITFYKGTNQLPDYENYSMRGHDICNVPPFL